MTQTAPETVKLVAVIAAMDERDNIAPLCGRLLATVHAVPGLTFEAIFVVKGEDVTEAAQVAHNAPEIRVIRPEQARGLGAAFRLVCAAMPADADLEVTLDADPNHAPEDIPRLVRALDAAAADIVIGSRHLPSA